MADAAADKSESAAEGSSEATTAAAAVEGETKHAREKKRVMRIRMKMNHRQRRQRSLFEGLKKMRMVVSYNVNSQLLMNTSCISFSLQI